MSRLRVAAFGISLDGFGAGPDLRALGYECAESFAGERATHRMLRRR
jgi:hypothetical protein